MHTCINIISALLQGSPNKQKWVEGQNELWRKQAKEGFWEKCHPSKLKKSPADRVRKGGCLEVQAAFQIHSRWTVLPVQGFQAVQDGWPGLGEVP